MIRSAQDMANFCSILSYTEGERYDTESLAFSR